MPTLINRVHIMTQAERVTVVEDPTLIDGFVVLVEGGKEYMDAMQDASARVKLLVGDDSTVCQAALAVHRAIWALGKARQVHPRGNLPPLLVQETLQTENRFIAAAHADLSRPGSG